jgi:NAD(P)-dependent dehydrogenase (short-subunit alcohol dehydrogenase family)
MSQSKIIIITGASRGIGLAASKYLLSQGHKVVAVARSKAPLEKLAADSPDRVLPLAVDLSSLVAGRVIVDATLEKWQRIDGVIINHGTLEPIKRIADSTAEEWRASFDINTFSGIALVSKTQRDQLYSLSLIQSLLDPSSYPITTSN